MGLLANCVETVQYTDACELTALGLFVKWGLAPTLILLAVVWWHWPTITARLGAGVDV